MSHIPSNYTNNYIYKNKHVNKNDSGGKNFPLRFQYKNISNSAGIPPDS
jgi:hypothetical protein